MPLRERFFYLACHHHPLRRFLTRPTYQILLHRRLSTLSATCVARRFLGPTHYTFAAFARSPELAVAA